MQADAEMVHRKTLLCKPNHPYCLHHNQATGDYAATPALPPHLHMSSVMPVRCWRESGRSRYSACERVRKAAGWTQMVRSAT